MSIGFSGGKVLVQGVDSNGDPITLLLNTDGSLDATFTQVKGTKTFGAHAVTNVAALLVAENLDRLTLSLVNNGKKTVYLGKDNTLTALNGTPLPPTGSVSDDNSNDAWWGITESGTSDVRSVEVA